jgi:hypothetical protein
MHRACGPNLRVVEVHGRVQPRGLACRARNHGCGTRARRTRMGLRSGEWVRDATPWIAKHRRLWRIPASLSSHARFDKSASVQPVRNLEQRCSHDVRGMGGRSGTRDQRLNMLTPPASTRSMPFRVPFSGPPLGIEPPANDRCSSRRSVRVSANTPSRLA